MSRLISLNQQVSPVAARHEWRVAADHHPLKRMDSSALLEKLGAVATSLVVDQGRLVAGEIEKLEVHSEVRPGERLVATAALEPSRFRRKAVSVVVKAEQRLVVAGVLTFVPTDEPSRLSTVQRDRVRSSARDGKSFVETSFHARTPGDDWLLHGNPLAWVQASALLSAQGFVGGPAELIGLQGLSRLGPVRSGETLVLQCSVVHVANDVVSVLSHVRTEHARHDVLYAVSSFRAQHAPALLREWPHWLGVAPPNQ